VIKQYTKASPEIEEAERERRTWGATVIAEGETATADLRFPLFKKKKTVSVLVLVG